MDLLTAYRETEKRLNSIDFSALWEGFERAEFALYNDSEVIFRGERLEKTDEFLANTTICFRGENIAIWMLSEETDLDVLASKLAHEMFHAYQMDKREARFPNESDGVFRYSFSPEPLSGRLRLNRALVRLCREFSMEGYAELLSLLRLRREAFPLEYAYECGVESIEGSAQYVEQAALYTLSPEKQAAMLERRLSALASPQSLMNTRESCYDFGMALLIAMKHSGLPVNTRVGGTMEFLVPQGELGKVPAAKEELLPEAAEAAERREAETRAIIARMTAKKPEMTGSFELAGFNVYSARFLDGYLYSEYFLQVKGDEAATLFGNCLAKIENERVTEIYIEK